MRLLRVTLFVFAAIFLAAWLLPRTLAPIPVEAGQARLEMAGRGFFFRQEEVVVAPAAGIVQPIVEDGEQVAAGTPVMAYDDGDKPWESLLAGIEAALVALEETYANQTGETAVRAAAVGEAANALLVEARDRDASSFRQQALRLSAALHEYRGARKKAEETRQARERLLGRQTSLQEVFQPGSGQLLAPEAGVVRYGLDPLSSRLQRWDEEPLLPSELVSRDEIRPGNEVEAGEPLFRVGTPWVAYWAVDVPADRAEGLSQGGRLDLTLETDEPVSLPCELVQQGPPEEGRVVLVIRSDSLGSGNAYPLEAPVKITGPVVEGVVLPRRAVVEKEDRTGVYLLSTDRSPRWQPVTVLARPGPDRVLVGGIEPGAVVSARPWLAQVWQAMLN